MAGQSSYGSSPRVRGKRRRGRRPCGSSGLIPACAGKTRGGHPVGVRRAAHPRVCGENPETKATAHRNAGSSPRVRGKLQSVAGQAETGGLIPACAGKTPPRPRTRSSRRAHPRVCGENPPFVLHRFAGRGSSPRVRGKLRARVHGHSQAGLIPACAGKTPSIAAPRPRRRAHPRVCGENQRGFHNTDAVAGSSPRVRGKPEGGGLGGDRVRLIPACAGKTSTPQRAQAPRPAHPRACGENMRRAQGYTGGGGSSPRVRGKRPPGPPRRPPAGLIPARAGKTSSSSGT